MGKKGFRIQRNEEEESNLQGKKPRKKNPKPIKKERRNNVANEADKRPTSGRGDKLHSKQRRKTKRDRPTSAPRHHTGEKIHYHQEATIPDPLQTGEGLVGEVETVRE